LIIEPDEAVLEALTADSPLPESGAGSPLADRPVTVKVNVASNQGTGRRGPPPGWGRS